MNRTISSVAKPSSRRCLYPKFYNQALSLVVFKTLGTVMKSWWFYSLKGVILFIMIEDVHQFIVLSFKISGIHKFCDMWDRQTDLDSSCATKKKISTKIYCLYFLFFISLYKSFQCFLSYGHKNRFLRFMKSILLQQNTSTLKPLALL